MRNKYEYLDPDYTYADRKTGILYNLAGFSNGQDMEFFERYMDGTINGDIYKLSILIYELVSE